MVQKSSKVALVLGRKYVSQSSFLQRTANATEAITVALAAPTSTT